MHEILKHDPKLLRIFDVDETKLIAVIADNGQILSYSKQLEVKKQIQDLLLHWCLTCKNTIDSIADYAIFSDTKASSDKYR